MSIWNEPQTISATSTLEQNGLKVLTLDAERGEIRALHEYEINEEPGTVVVVVAKGRKPSPEVAIGWDGCPDRYMSLEFAVAFSAILQKVSAAAQQVQLILSEQSE